MSNSFEWVQTIDWADAGIQLVVTSIGVFLAVAFQDWREQKAAQRIAESKKERRKALLSVLEVDVRRLSESALRALNIDLKQGQKWVPQARLQGFRDAVDLPKWDLVKSELLHLEPEYESLERFAGFYSRLERLHVHVNQATLVTDLDVESFGKATEARCQLAGLVVEGIFVLKKSLDNDLVRAGKSLEDALPTAS
ncbi:MAG: hypothetical protein ACYC2H_13605 [Thermoplasmatota archaeon]